MIYSKNYLISDKKLGWIDTNEIGDGIAALFDKLLEDRCNTPIQQKEHYFFKIF